ncbi:MAG: type II toxin-antitoxin system Phd/YefM family antitoxin, partial [Acetobacteraceae bacterium]
MKEVPLSEVKDDLSRFLREAEKQEIVITRHGRPAGVLIGFESEEDWLEYRLESWRPIRGFSSGSNEHVQAFVPGVAFASRMSDSEWTARNAKESPPAMPIFVLSIIIARPNAGAANADGAGRVTPSSTKLTSTSASECHRVSL